MQHPAGIRFRAAVLLLVGWAWVAALGGCAAGTNRGLVDYQVAGDAIGAPLTSTPGDAGNGLQIVRGRDGNCLLCHAVPETGVRFMGNLAPPLSGLGSRLSAGQMRLRIVDARYLNAETIMPSYYRTSGLNRVGTQWLGKPILSAQQVEDVIAYLVTLR